MSARTRAVALVLGVVGAVLLGQWTVSADSLDALGAADPGSPGFNAMAVGLDGFAYLGSWGSGADCPALGVRVFDIQEPTQPAYVTTAAAYSGTTAEHVAVQHYANSAFTGTVLFTGLQRCNAAGTAPAGLAMWDVTDPRNPSELAVFPVGRGLRGVHEFTVAQRGDRWYAYLAVSNSEISGSAGDLRIVDVTDPRNPFPVADWGARKDAGLPIGTGAQCRPVCRGAVPQSFLHSVTLSPDGQRAYLSYWDLGVLIVDVSNPAAPQMIGRYAEPEAAEGNTHSVSLTPDERLALVADETFGPPWGRLRLVDIRDLSNPFQVATFETANSAAGTPGDEYAYTIHNPLVDPRDPRHAYLAWYSDGIRMIDISDPAHPTELAAWVPPGGGQIWNVSFYGDLLLAGDINNGLYILHR